MSIKNIPELTTLCYIEHDGKYLMLHRTKKENDINKDKYIGIGGHFEYGESPDECLKREVFEETGLTLSSFRARGIVTFIYGRDVVEYMHLFTAEASDTMVTAKCEHSNSYKDVSKDISKNESTTPAKTYVNKESRNIFCTLPECDEGELVLVDKSSVYILNIWEGDAIFFRLLEENRPFFLLKLVYSECDELMEVTLDGEIIQTKKKY